MYIFRYASITMHVSLYIVYIYLSPPLTLPLPIYHRSLSLSLTLSLVLYLVTPYIFTSTKVYSSFWKNTYSDRLVHILISCMYIVHVQCTCTMYNVQCTCTMYMHEYYLDILNQNSHNLSREYHVIAFNISHTSYIYITSWS